MQIKTRAERRVGVSFLVYFWTRNIKNIWPTDGAQWRNVPCRSSPQTHALTSLTADRGIYEYLCFGMKECRLGRWADIGLTGLWGRRCLLNDFYHRNLRLAMLNRALNLNLILISLSLSEQRAEHTGEGFSDKSSWEFPGSCCTKRLMLVKLVSSGGI